MSDSCHLPNCGVSRKFQNVTSFVHRGVNLRTFSEGVILVVFLKESGVEVHISSQVPRIHNNLLSPSVYFLSLVVRGGQ